MTSMIRKQIYITTELEAELKRQAQVTGESEAELVRQALASYLQGPLSAPSHLRAWQEERTYIQSLMDQDSAPGTRTWTREELYDRYDRKVSR